MKYGVYREETTMVEVLKLNHNTIEIVKTDLVNGTEQSITLTKQQLNKIDQFLKLGVHYND